MGQYLEFITNHPLLIAALVILIAMLIMNEFKRKLLGYKEVGPNDAVRLINREDAVILDVRDDKEFQSGHILNSVHIPLGLLDSQLSKLGEDREKAVVVVCQSGQRAAKGAVLLQKQGFKSVHKLNGGMMAWSEAGMPVNRGKNKK